MIEMESGRVEKEEAIRRHTAILGSPYASAKTRFESGGALRILSRDGKPVSQSRTRR